MAKPSIETHDFAASPTTSKSFTIPSNTWMIDIVGRGLGFASSHSIDARFGSVSTSSYLRSYHTGLADDVDKLTRISVGAASTSAGSGFGLRIYAPELVAPTPWFHEAVNTGTTSVNISAGIQNDVTAFSDFEIFSFSGGTINAGDVWVTYHKRTNEIIESVDFGAAAASSHDFTGVTNRNSLVLVSKGLAGASSSGTPRVSVSTDGVSFDQGATDYKHNEMNVNNNVGGDSAYLHSVGFDSLTNDFLCIMENGRAAGPTSLIHGISADDADTGPRHQNAYRNSTDKHSGYRVEKSDATDFDAGVLWLLGAK